MAGPDFGESCSSNQDPEILPSSRSMHRLEHLSCHRGSDASRYDGALLTAYLRMSLIRLSASDLVGFLNCGYLTQLELLVASGERSKPYNPDPLEV